MKEGAFPNTKAVSELTQCYLLNSFPFSLPVYVLFFYLIQDGHGSHVSIRHMKMMCVCCACHLTPLMFAPCGGQ